MDVKQKRKQLHHLLFKIGAAENKKDFLANYGVESSTELSESTLDEIIQQLQLAAFQKREATAKTRHWRSNVLTLLNKCGIYNTNNDWCDVNRFLLNPRISGKVLYMHSIEDMQTLCKKLRIIAIKKADQRKKELINFSSN